MYLRARSFWDGSATERIALTLEPGIDALKGRAQIPRFVRVTDRITRQLFRPLQLVLLLLSGWICWAILGAWRDQEGPNRLMVPVQINSAAETHVYYDVGNGLWHGDVARVQHPGGMEWHVLSFPLPREPIRSLRFDPLIQPGKFALRAPWLEARSGRVIARFPLTAVSPQHQIEEWVEFPDYVEAKTVDSADDAQVQFELGLALRVGSPRWPWGEGIGWLVLAGGVWAIGRHKANVARISWRRGVMAVIRNVGVFCQRLARQWVQVVQRDSARLVVLGALLVMVAQLWILRDLGNTLDLPMWDESHYASRGHTWMHQGGRLGELHTGPAYAVSYAVLAIVGEPAEMVFWQHRVVKVGGALCLYLVLWGWSRRWAFSAAMSLVWACSSFQIEFPALVYQAAWVYFLLAVFLARIWPSMALLALIFAVGFRQDYQFALPIMIGLIGWRKWLKFRQSASVVNGGRLAIGRGWIRWGRIGLVVLALVGIGWVVRDVQFGGLGQRGWFAFQQHYAVRAVAEGEAPEITVPFAEYPQLVERDFPGATSLREAWDINRPAALRHVGYNFKEAIPEIGRLWWPHPNLTWAAGILLVAAFVLLGPQYITKAPATVRDQWLIAAAGILVIAPGLVVLAKGAYLLPLLPALLLGLGCLWRRMVPMGWLERGGRGALIGAVALGVGMISLAVANPVFVPGSRPRPVLDQLDALRQIWPASGQHTLVGFGASSMANYLTAPRCHWVEPLNSVTGDSAPDRTIAQLLNEEQPFAILVTDGWRNAASVDDEALAVLAENPEWSVRSVDGALLYWRSDTPLDH